MKRMTDVFTCYYDRDGCYDEWRHDIHNPGSCRSLVQDILLLPESNETDYTRIFVSYDDDTLKEITLGDIKTEGYIEEDWSTGKSTRTFSCCGNDCTKMTSWMIPKYCPWCGAKIKGERLKPCFHVDLGEEIDYEAAKEY